MIYLIATPIGNLADISLRALDVLKEVDLIACEDTRTSKILLDHYNIKKKLVSYHKFNEAQRAAELIEFAKAGQNIGVISDAGMPGISDPGNYLIREAIEKGVDYTLIPGASAFSAALVLSGFENSRFTFYGFFPGKTRERKALFEEIKRNKHTMIFYEAPHKLDKTMEDLLDIIPDRRMAIVREISKLYEDVKIFTVRNYFQTDIVKKGEMVLLIDADESEEELSDEFITAELEKFTASGMTKKMAVKEVCKLYKLPKNQVYELSLGI
ncbi:16S rRNA (cytidine(1402)-2'-O)-methyltransferase [Peptoniphilaceae bacterium SGI.131]